MSIVRVFEANDLSPDESLEILAFTRNSAGLRRLSLHEEATQTWLSNSGRLVFKVFDIPRLKQRWRARWGIDCPEYGKRYGQAEFTNALRFAHLGISAPALCAYIEMRGLLTCSRQVVVYRCLSGMRTLQEHLEAGAEPFALLENIDTVLLEMTEKGVFHLDLNSRNVMLDRQGQVSVIDFEYVTWVAPGLASLYGYYWGYLFQKWAGKHIGESEYESWVTERLERQADRASCSPREISRWYMTGKTKEFSRSKRYRMFV
ncbi:lipopolysaccharide kinase InaA family protein [Pseudomonas sp. LABIM340]|uniref:lipopolysaccharide kinase InaA family protein n=1 Tax=Pseudomonas sp. LABIM340 TaxID=3156585 RepID=UPI0032AE9B26